MSSNPLLGSRISLISKKNIRYEGTLYSINEADATVALQDVKSFGTEGRELLDATGMSTFVPPNDRVHAYLLFRGQDIKDLHVHEKTSDDASKPAEAAAVTDTPTPPAPAAPAAPVTPSVAPTTARGEAKPVPSPSQAPAPALAKADSKQAQNESNAGGKKEAAAEKRPARSQKQQQQKQQQQGEKTKGAPASKNESDSPKAMQPEGTGIGESKENKPAPPKTASSASGGANRKNQNMVGTGASLLNRKARGAKEDKELMVDGEFDFESNLAEFDKANMSNEQGDDDDDANEGNDAYSKDDFFDTISSEATDRVNGIDNRLRGSAERNLNLDTFGAVSLGNQPGRKRYYGGRDGGRGGRGWRGGRGRGRGRGGGRGRDGGSGGGYQGNRGGGGDGVSHNNNSRHEQGGGPVPRQNNRWKEMSSTSAY